MVPLGFLGPKKPKGDRHHTEHDLYEMFGDDPDIDIEQQKVPISIIGQNTKILYLQ